ncbi:MAG: hypothetical protein M0C28_42565 [Candidatus Moduliflexus flocculans]|nr:hypothetical protein [Candidatus Moduliflexus flocculans]
MLDLDTGKIVKTIRRKYRRIPHIPFRGEAEFNRKYNFKKPYDADIRGLYVLV